MVIEEEFKRTLNINHQKVALDIDFSSKSILASTELEITFNKVELPYFRLHSKGCDIKKVLINNIETKFEIFDPCAETCKTFSNAVSKDYNLLQKFINSSRDFADVGELAIEVPQQIDIKQHLTPGIKIPDSNIESSAMQSSPVFLRIEYSIINPQAGVVFSSNGRGKESNISSYLYTLNQLGPGDARYWVPTLDDVNQRSTWELDFILNNQKIKSKLTPSVVASGVQVCQNKILSNNTTLYRYFVAFSCPAYLVSFAIGQFDSMLLAELDNYENEEVNDNNENENSNDYSKQIIAYAPAGWKEELRHSTQTVEKTVDYYVNEFGAYPLDSLKLVFIQTSNIPLIVGAEVIIIGLQYLHSDEIIDQTFETRRIIALALASQWFGVNIIPKEPTDIWITLGLSGFMTSLFLKMHFGYNEYRYRMKKDMIKISELDVNRPPLYNDKLAYPYDLEDISFIRLKGTFVLYMLDKQLLKGAAAFGLHKLIPKILMSAIVGELGPGNTISTLWFLKTCRKASGVDIKSFAEQWVFCSGCPIFSFKYSFNRKKMVVEIDFKQTTTNTNLNFDTQEQRDLIKPARVFTGNLTACIQEPDGTPYEHILEIQENSTHFEVQFNTKYKRIRRNTKRFQKRKAEAAAAEAAVKDQLEGDNPDDDVLFLTEEGNEKEKRAWRIVEWGEEDLESLESATFEWIRLDSDFEWICKVELEQPDYMWAGQLEKDRDVVSQYEAVVALQRFPSLATSTTLLRTIMNSQCFYRIRADAARMLVYCSLPQFDYIGRDHLLRIYHKKYCIDNLEDEKNPELFVPRPNDFNSFPEYFVQKALVSAISLLDEPINENYSQKLILKLLKSNDNSSNPYSDSYYVSVLISSIGNMLVARRTPSEYRPLTSIELDLYNELKRFSTMDHLIPSYHNIVTVSCLQVYTKIFIAGVVEPDISIFMKHSRYGNFLHVRMAAFDGLMLNGGLFVDAIRKYLLYSIENDPEPYMRYYIVSNMARIISLYQHVHYTNSNNDHFNKELGNGKGEFNHHQRGGYENGIDFDDNIDDDYLTLDYGQTPKDYSKEKWIEFQNNIFCRDVIWKMLLDSNLDSKIRNSLHIICKLLYPLESNSEIDFSSFKIRIFDPLLIKSKEDYLKEVEKEEVKQEPIKSNKNSIENQKYDKRKDSKDKRNVNIKIKPTQKQVEQITLKDKDPFINVSRSPSPINVTASFELKPISKSPIHGPQFSLTNNNRESSNEDTFISIISPTMPPNKEVDIVNIDNENEPEVSISPIEEDKPISPPKIKTDVAKLVNIKSNRNLMTTKLPKKHHRKQFSPESPSPSKKHPLYSNNRPFNNIDSFDKNKVKSSDLTSTPIREKVPNEIDTEYPNEESVFKEIPINIGNNTQSIDDKFDIKLRHENSNRSSEIKMPKVADDYPKVVLTEPKACKRIVKKLARHPSGVLLKKFDPNKEEITIPNVKNSEILSFDTIIEKADSETYSSISELKRDISILFKVISKSTKYSGKELEEVKIVKAFYKVELDMILPTIVPSKAKSPIPIQNLNNTFYPGKPYETAKGILKDIMDMNEASPFKMSSTNPLDDAKSISKSTTILDLTKIRYTLKSKLYKSSYSVYRDLHKFFNELLEILEPTSSNFKNAKRLLKHLNTAWHKEFPNDLTEEINKSDERDSPRHIEKIKVKEPQVEKVRTYDVNKRKEILYEFGKRLVDKLELHPSSPSFRLPVDPVALGIPTYFDVVKNPMSFTKLHEKLKDKSSYKQFSDLDADIKLLFSNAYLFNQPESWVYQEAKKLSTYYDSLKSKFRDIFEESDYDSLNEIMERLSRHDCSKSFKTQTKFSYLMKDPIDLSIIKSRVDKRYYTHFNEFENDFIEMLHTAFSHFDTNDEGYKDALKLEMRLAKYFKEKFSKENHNIGKISEMKPKVFMTTVIQSSCEKLLKKIMSNKAAEPFLTAVNYKALNIPEYPKIVRLPRNFGLIKKNLSTKVYKTPFEFKKDVKLVFSNCYNYNGLGNYYSDQALTLEALFDKEWDNITTLFSKSKPTSNQLSKTTTQHAPPLPVNNAAPPPSTTITKSDNNVMSNEQFKSLASAFNELSKHAHYYIFGEPVDYIALNIPTYPEVVKQPMDFGTIQNRLKAKRYKSVKQVLADSKLVFNNCYLFNYPTDPVYKMGKELEQAWQQILKKFKLHVYDEGENEQSENKHLKRSLGDLSSTKFKHSKRM